MSLEAVLDAQTDRPATPEINFSALAFFKRMQKKYQSLFEIIGRDWTTLLEMAAWASRALPGKNHGSIIYPLTEAQKKALKAVLADMEFFKALKLRPGTYGELHVTGAKRVGIEDRVIDIVNHYLMPSANEPNPNRRYTFKRITCQVGQRPRQIVSIHPKTKVVTPMDGTIEEIVGSLSPAVLANPWVQRELQKLNDPNRPAGTSDDDRDLWWGPFASETELMILAWVKAYDGNVVVGAYEAISEEQRFPEVPARTFASVTLTLPDGTPVLVLNAPAVERSHGDPRPTTSSATAYWLEHYTPEYGTTIVCVTGPAHGYRVSHSFEKNMHAVRPDITVFGMSRPAKDPWAVFNNALGEAVWLLVKAFEELVAELPAEMKTILEWRFQQIQEQTVKEMETFLEKQATVSA